MNRSSRGALVVALALMLCACVTRPAAKYDWGTYDPSLYTYYKDPAKASELMAALQSIINGANTGRGAVPPGVYAEYGYLQLQQGKAQEAVASFQAEEQRWPESKAFMDRMIKVASTRPKPAQTKEP
jgi:hypothetical protein